MIELKVNRKLSLHVEQELLTNLAEEGRIHFPNEFGGFLIGHYSDNLEILFVEDYLNPKVYQSSPVLFEREMDGMTEEFNIYYKNKKQYFIGEWHTHPNGTSHYSQTDLKTMIEIKKCSTVNILNPILMIISVDQEKLLEYSFYLLDNDRLKRYE